MTLITCINLVLTLRIDWIEWQGNKHQVGDFGYQDGLRHFGKLSEILVIASKIFFYLNLYSTKGIDRHHNSFIIHPDPTQNKLIKLITDEPNHRLISFQGHSLNSSSGTLHIVCKYFILKI